MRERLTVHRVVTNSVPDLLHDAPPADLFKVVRVRNDKPDLVVVFVVFPATQSTTDADMLRNEVSTYILVSEAIRLRYWSC